MILINPHTGKPVDVSSDFVDRLLSAGFTEQKREDPEPAQRPARKRGRPRKSADTADAE